MKKVDMNAYGCFLMLFLSGWLTPNVSAQPWEKKFSHEVYEAIANGELRSSSASYVLNDIGNYQGALQLNEVRLEWGLDTLNVDKPLNIVGPEEYFSSIKDDVKVVIVSEAHQKPQHRIFTRRILKSLYDQGFRHLGIEALTPNFDNPHFVLDSLLNERKYPMGSPLTGRYAMEPMMGQLIREALQMGFTVFGYDEFGGDVERDLGQAMTIKKMMDQYPDGKFLIHCGWYHAIESNYPKRRDGNYMAHHLKQLTGMDPLTVYQDVLSEKYLYKESPIYDKLSGEMGIVVNEEDGTPLKLIDHFDLLVFHPRTTFQYGRPSFLLSNPGWKSVELSLGEYDFTYPVRIEATLDSEVIEATPLDRMEQLSRYQNMRLVLPQGDYNIQIIDIAGKLIHFVLKVE